ncbi:hypothetical protein [Reyranella soli]|nr:hypothetical protein [Reyranella soli]
METAETDNWVHLGEIARRLAARLITQRLAAADDIGTALIPPPSNDNGAQGQVHEFTPATAPCSVATPT